jgi:hypothetical protein
MVTNWQTLAKKIGALDDDGSESGGDSYAEQAFDEIFGDEWIENTVDFIIGFNRSGELAMNCLRYFQSTKATEYAYKIYKASDCKKASQEVWLIKHLANPISLPWIEEFLNDQNVLQWGLGALDQLLWKDRIQYDEKAVYLLNLADKNSNGFLKEHTNFIRDYMAKRNS